MFFKILMIGAVLFTVGVPATYLVLQVQPAPAPPGPNHAFVNNDADGTCDQPMNWVDSRGRFHTQCDQTHQDPYNVPSHVQTPAGPKYLGEGKPADNNYH